MPTLIDRWLRTIPCGAILLALGSCSKGIGGGAPELRFANQDFLAGATSIGTGARVGELYALEGSSGRGERMDGTFFDRPHPVSRSLPAVDALALDVVRDVFYALRPGDSLLYSIQRSDGSMQPIGDTGLQATRRHLAYNPDLDKIYLAASSDGDGSTPLTSQVATLSPRTGQVETQVSIDIPFENLATNGAITYDPLTQQLYLLRHPIPRWWFSRPFPPVDPGSLLRRLDPATGGTTQLLFTTVRGAESLAFDGDRNRIYTLDPASQRLSVIDLTASTSARLPWSPGLVELTSNVSGRPLARTTTGLVSFDPESGVRQPSRSSAIASVAAAAFDPGRGELFVADGSTGTIAARNLATGTWRTLSSDGPRTVTAMAFGPDPVSGEGALMVVVSGGSSDELHRIDPDSGVARRAGPLGNGFGRVQGLAWVPPTGQLVGVRATTPGPSELIEIDPLGGTALQLAPLLDLHLSLAGLTYHPPSGRLLASADTSDSAVVAIDPATGRFDLLAGTGFNDVRALAYDGGADTVIGLTSQRQALTIDPNTGRGTSFPGGRLPALTCLAYRPAQDRFVGRRRGHGMVTIDASTRVVRALPQLGLEHLGALAWDHTAGALMAFDRGNNQRTELDPTDGAPRRPAHGARTTIPGGLSATQDPVTGTIWVVAARDGAQASSNAPQLYSMDPTTGRARRALDTTSAPGGSIRHVAWGDPGVLYAASPQGELSRIDPMVGTITPIGQVAGGSRNDIRGLVHDPETQSLLVLVGTQLRRIDLANPTLQSHVGTVPSRWAADVARDPSTGRIYAADQNFLFSIDPTTGARGDVCVHSLQANIDGFAFDPTTGHYFGVVNHVPEHTGQTAILELQGTNRPYRSNVIQEPSVVGIHAMAIDDAGRILASTDTSLVELDPASGAARPIGNFPIETGLVTGLAFDRDTGVLYGSSENGLLLSISPDTGAVTPVSQPEPLPPFQGLTHRRR